MIYPYIAAFIAALIEFLRIKHGKDLNVNKVWTYTIASILLGFCMALHFDYYSDASFFDAWYYVFYFACVRGLIYSPLLNILRGKYIFYQSKTTNSKLDKLLSKIPMVYVQLIYLFLIILYYVTK